MSLFGVYKVYSEEVLLPALPEPKILCKEKGGWRARKVIPTLVGANTALETQAVARKQTIEAVGGAVHVGSETQTQANRPTQACPVCLLTFTAWDYKLRLADRRA